MQLPVPSDNTAIPAQQLSREAEADARSEDGDRPEAAHTWSERLLGSFTPYAELEEAERAPEDQRDERVGNALKRLQKEWALVAASVRRPPYMREPRAGLTRGVAARAGGHQRCDFWARAGQRLPD